MKVIVTGATGFVGRHVVSQLLASGHTVVAVARDRGRARSMPWFDEVEFVAHDLHGDEWNWHHSATVDALIHLAWPGLPNYLDFSHIGKNLPADLRFLESAVQAGVPRLIVAGTCLEYGLQHGPLGEEMDTHPHTPYGFAKDALRKSLEILRSRKAFTLQWVRLFYMYGEGQNPNSLLSQLDRALDEGRETFEMSFGDQLRDYLPIKTVARCFDWVVAHPNMRGVINCCSGKPISVLDLVNQHLERRCGRIRFVRGHYPYPDYEPMAFWGIPAKLCQTGFDLGDDLNKHF
ncbi:MAG: NAD-dependent epimerase/dehydratase family protein [Acidiferrobacter sp.]